MTTNTAEKQIHEYHIKTLFLLGIREFCNWESMSDLKDRIVGKGLITNKLFTLQSFLDESLPLVEEYTISYEHAAIIVNAYGDNTEYVVHSIVENIQLLSEMYKVDDRPDPANIGTFLAILAEETIPFCHENGLPLFLNIIDYFTCIGKRFDDGLTMINDPDDVEEV